MSSIDIRNTGITSIETDVVVNAANERLMEGSGVCGAIFRAAGSRELQRACNEIGKCDTGDAVITSGFNLKAKYVIHAVGPIWSGGYHGEQKLLKSAYKRSLELAKENGCNSIVFPLISAGVFGYPVEKAWEDALTTCREYIDSHPDFHIDIVFTEIDEEKYRTGKKVLRRLEGDTPEHEEIRCDQALVAGHIVSQIVDGFIRQRWQRRTVGFIQIHWCHRYSNQRCNT